MIIGKGAAVTLTILIVIFSSLVFTIASIMTVPKHLLGGDEITVITRAGDPNPLRSSIDIEIAYALKNLSFIRVVSPEIILFSTYSERAITIRGVWYEEFLKIEKGKITEGRLPQREDECLVGEGLKKRLKIALNEEITIFGSFKSSMSILKVVGVFRTSTLANDELIVSLPVARNLCGLGKNAVSLIRVIADDKEKMKVVVDPNIPKFILTDINIPLNAYLYDMLPVKFRIRNWGLSEGNIHIEISFCNKTYNMNTSLKGNSEKECSLNVTASEIGQHYLNIKVNDKVFPYTYSTLINISKKPIFVTSPSTVEVNKTYTVFVSSVEGPLENATIISDENIWFTDRNGYANISFKRVGLKSIRVEKNAYENTTIFIKVIEYVSPENLFTILNPKCSKNSTEFYLLNGSKKLVLKPYSNKIRIYYSISNSSKIAVDSNTIYLNWTDGWYNITLYAEDDYNITHLNITVFIDSLLPIITPNFISPTNLRPGESLKIMVKDNLELLHTRIKIYNLSYQLEVFNSSIEISNTSEFRGEYTVVVNSTDVAYNWNNVTLYYNFIEVMDDTPPIILPLNETHINSGQTIVFKAKDNFRLRNATLRILYDQILLKEIEYKLISSNVAIKIETASINDTAVSYWKEGEYTFFLYVEDVYKNGVAIEKKYIIKNEPDYTSPIILVEKKSILYTEESLSVSFWDNLLLTKIGYFECNKTFVLQTQSPYARISINASEFSLGTHHLTLFAEDIYSNNFTLNISLTILTEHVSKPIINYSAYLMPEEITINETAILVVEVCNYGDAAGQLKITILIDNRTYAETFIQLQPMEKKTLIFNLPPLPAGQHTISFMNYTFILSVYRHSLANIPVEKIIRYTKDIDIKAKGDTVYKALELSEGNFMLLVFSIVSTVMTLLLMGIITVFSKNIKSKEKNIGILRALGAVKYKIIKITITEILLKCVPLSFLGTFVGYLIVLWLNENGFITAFGHSLLFSPDFSLFIYVFLIPIIMTIISNLLLINKILKKRPVYMIKKLAVTEESFDIEEILGDNA